MRYLRICLILTYVLNLCSCEKFVEDKKKQAAMSFITDGQWIIQSYLEDTVSVTSEFEGYTFKFNENGTVNGIRGAIIEEGTWVGDLTNYSIISEFPLATHPLVKLNGTWFIKDSGAEFVKADMKTTTSTIHLLLKKI